MFHFVESGNEQLGITMRPSASIQGPLPGDAHARPAVLEKDGASC
jgi:hypothetical protein